MNRFALASIALICASLYAGSSLAAETAAAAKNAGGNAPLATVNGVTLKQSAADLMFKEQANKGVQETPELKKAVRDELIMRELFAQEAHKKGLDKNEEVQAKLDMARQSVLAGAYMDSFMKTHPITDADIQKEYQRQIQLAGPQEFKLRHIVVKTEQEAEDIIKQLKAGTKFETLAEKSEDTSTRPTGGDLGWTRPSAFVEPMRTAILALKKGEYTATALKSNVGYHIVQVDDVRPTEMPPLESMKDRLRQALTQDAVKAHGTELRAAAKVQ
jgi:peptidyl-prolyl cis-trans isomerase C